MTKQKQKTKKLYYDVKKCLGCRSCEIACAVAHSQSKELFKALKEEVAYAPLETCETADEKGA